ncbi:MAG: 30S ribosomal protein S9 [Planctomycetota bacterium]|jgi:small subunit ribosomal protein S9
MTEVVAKRFIWGTGRRKSSVARVRLSIGTGQITVNRKPFDQHFLTEQDRTHAMEPLSITKTRGKYDFFITCEGGGVTGQSGAVRLGISRALRKVDPSLEPKLRELQMLTRDPRMKERKKYGRRGARRGTQYSKR